MVTLKLSMLYNISENNAMGSVFFSHYSGLFKTQSPLALSIKLCYDSDVVNKLQINCSIDFRKVINNFFALYSN